MAELNDHIRAASDNLNRLLATISDPDQGKLITQLFTNIVDAMCAVRAERNAEEHETRQEEHADEGGEAPVRTPHLEAAVDAGDIEGVKRLVAAGAGINAADHNGCTPLSRAVLRGHADIAEFLINMGARVNTRAVNGWTALDIAEHRRSKGLCELLLAHGGKSGKEVA